MTKATMTNGERYNVFFDDDLELVYDRLNEKDLITYFNGMITDINNDCEENYSKAKTIEDVLKMQKDFGWIIKDVLKVNVETFRFIIEQALKFNTAWHGRTKKTDKGFYSFEVKPLYINHDSNNILFQVACSKMCPSGISDNGIMIVKQIETNLTLFDNDIRQNINMLVKYVLHSPIQIDYIKF